MLLVVIVFALLFGAVTVVRLGKQNPTTTDVSSSKAKAIRTFWEQYNRASAARLRGDYASAVGSYRKALELDADHQDSLFYLAVSLQETGRYDEAVSVLRKLTTLYPEHSRGWSQLGGVLSTEAPGARPDFDAAEAALVRSQELNREHTGPFLGRGMVELQKGRLEEAHESFQVAAASGAPEGLLLVGLTRYLQGNDEGAADSFVRVLEANAREKAITGRGVLSEGDVKKSGTAGDLTAFERAGIQSLVFLYWTAQRLGGYPDAVPDPFRLDLGSRPSAAAPFEPAPLAVDTRGRGSWLDYDRDGRADLLVASGAGLKLLRNGLTGWTDVTRVAGLEGAGENWEGCPLDVDGDGWDDLFLAGSGHMGSRSNRLYRNREGHFRDVTGEWGLAGERSTARAVSADFDGDGRVDLLEVGSLHNGDPPVRLFLNQGSLFRDSAAEWGLVYPTHVVDAAVVDIDADGTQDIFILGWKAPGRLYRNVGSAFVDATAEAGLEGVGGEGLSVMFFDYDRDGDADLLVTAHAPLELSLQRLLDPSKLVKQRTPRLFRNSGAGRFEEVTAAVGLDRSYGVMQAVAADFDADGWPDLLFAQGGLDDTHLEPSVILRNREGKAFVEWGYLPSIRRPGNALGASPSDANGDGQIDVFLSGSGLFVSRARDGG